VKEVVSITRTEEDGTVHYELNIDQGKENFIIGHGSVNKIWQSLTHIRAKWHKKDKQKDLQEV
jgi:hypothetical protein